MVVEAGPSVESDADLVKKARSDPAAFGPLVERYQERILEHVRQRIGNYHDAEEVTQRTFMDVFRYIHRPNRPDVHYPKAEFIMADEGSFNNYIYQSARNRAANFLRRKSSHPTQALEDAPKASLWSSHFSDPEDEVERAEQRALVRRALAELDEDEAKVLMLRHANELSHAEIARELGIKENAAKARYHRASKRFRGVYIKVSEGPRSS